MRFLKILLSTAIFYTSVIYGQEPGVHFEKNLSWQEIKAKAKAENKNIFIDCYATWCVPCKKMDKEVYPVDSIGKYVNEHFISVKCQFDSTNSDNEETRSWYKDSRDIAIIYNISAYPTYLFLNSEGELLHKDLGFQMANSFKELCETALNPQKQYYAMQKGFRAGGKEYESMMNLIEMAHKLGEVKFEDTLRAEYIKYLENLTDDQFFSRDILIFIGKNVGFINSDQRVFKRIKDHTDRVDSLIRPDFSTDIVIYVIQKEEFYDKLWSDPINKVPYTRTPNWTKIETAVRKKFGKVYEERVVLPYEIIFYAIIKDWKSYAAVVEKAINKFPPKTNQSKFYTGTGGRPGAKKDSWALNGLAWDLFEQTGHKELLKKALTWSNLSIKLDNDSSIVHQYFDTKANILYRLGKTDEAIACEKQGMSYLKRDRSNEPIDKIAKRIYEETILKMKKGEPTWPVQDMQSPAQQ